MDSQPTYVILGASGGIGTALSHNLHQTGAQLVLGARDSDRLRQLGAELRADARIIDATDFDQVQALVQYAVDTYGQIDGIVNCVGSILLKPAHLTSLEEFETTLALNLHSAFYTVKAATRAMMKSGGSIVLCSSAVARTGLLNHEAIAAAKAGVIGLMRSAAATYANRGIRVNCVAPGLVESRMSERILRSKAGRAQSEAMHALGRIGKPEDVAGLIAFLLDSSQSSWVTGQVFGIDGGLGTIRPRG